MHQDDDHSRFRPDIEVLRAVAVLAVVLFHAEMPGVTGGYVGVDVFFVISGFLITGLLWRQAHSTGTVRLRDFYAARARRLLPASALVGVITMIASVALLAPLQARSVVGDGIASTLYVGNYRFLMQGVDYFAHQFPPSPFQHYWSLGVEEQFYLVWPALILGTAALIRLTRRRTRTQATSSSRPYLIVLAIVVTLSLALSWEVCQWVPLTAFFSLPTRAWQLGAGGLVALTAWQWRRLPPSIAAIVGWTGLGLILLACNRFSTDTLYPGTAALVPTIGGVLVIGAGCAAPNRGCGRILGASPMGAIGRISYSWYLWHWPVLVLAPELLGHELGLPARLGAALLSGALAVLTLRLIENPLRFAAPLRRSARAGLALGVGATACGLAAGLVLLTIVPPPTGHGNAIAPLTITAAPTPADSDISAHDAAVKDAFAQVEAAVAGSAALKAVPSNLDPPLTETETREESADLVRDSCLRNAWQVDQPDCALGDLGSKTTVAVVGDSNAAMWYPAFRQVAQQRHWRLDMVVKESCPMSDLPIQHARLHRKYTECEQWRANAIRQLRADSPGLVVVSMFRGYSAELGAGFRPYSPGWNGALTRLLQQLRGTGAKVMVLGPIPDPNTQAAICLSGHLDDARAWTPTRSAAVNANGIATESAAATAGGGYYADLTNLFCTPDLCPVIVGNNLVYLDGNHVTLAYARALAPAIGALVDRALV